MACLTCLFLGNVCLYIWLKYVCRYITPLSLPKESWGSACCCQVTFNLFFPWLKSAFWTFLLSQARAYAALPHQERVVSCVFEGPGSQAKSLLGISNRGDLIQGVSCLRIEEWRCQKGVKETTPSLASIGSLYLPGTGRTQGFQETRT